jgi:hypothetical protein
VPSVRPHSSSGLQTVLFLLDHPDPKQATVVKVIQERNHKHFRQAAGTPFTTGKLCSIPFECSGPLADAVLDGSYHSDNPIVQLLLDELVRPAGNAMIPPDDLVSAVTDKFKNWDETTSVSPFSKRYLSQYISLIRIIREPSKTQAPPAKLPLAAQALASTAKELLALHVRLLELAIQHKHSYTRWQQVANRMLKKTSAFPKSIVSVSFTYTKPT